MLQMEDAVLPLAAAQQTTKPCGFTEEEIARFRELMLDEVTICFNAKNAEGRNAKSAKTPAPSCRVSLCELCVKTFADFALKKRTGCKKRSRRMRNASLATHALPRMAALRFPQNIQEK